MKAEEKFLSAIGDIEDDFIAEAAAYTPRKQKERNRRVWKYGGALAACLIVTVVTCAALMPSEKTSGGDPLPETKAADLPLLTIEERQETGQAEKRTKKLPAEDDTDRDKAQNAPWTTGAGVEALPVYSNQAYGTVVASEDEDRQNGENSAARRKTVDPSELSDRVLMTAAAAGIDAEPADVTVTDENAAGIDGGHFVVKAENGQGSVQLTLDNKALIRFSQSVKLPEEYRVPADQRSEENMEKTASWLLSEYSRLTGFESSEASVEAFWQEGGQKWILSGCETAGDVKSQIVSYNLKRVFFQLDEEGNLSSIFLRDYAACSEEIEEYPIISRQEAETLLEEGEYVTKCGYSMPGTAYIRRVSLVYLAGENYNIFMPYYAFDVQLPAGAGGDGSVSADTFTEEYVDCGTYYVPAVKGEYIANMPKEKTK